MRVFLRRTDNRCRRSFLQDFPARLSGAACNDGSCLRSSLCYTHLCYTPAAGTDNLLFPALKTLCQICTYCIPDLRSASILLLSVPIPEHPYPSLSPPHSEGPAPHQI